MSFKIWLKNRLQTLNRVMTEPQDIHLQQEISNLKLRQKNIWCHQVLAPLRPTNFIPQSGWSLDSRVILCIANDIVANNRRQVVEFGSGISTFYISKLLASLGGKLYSFESDPTWYHIYQEALIKEGLEETVILSHAPLKPCEFALAPGTTWYDTDVVMAATQGLKIDTIIVDGPPRGYGYATRYPAIPALQAHLADTYTIILDDTGESDEIETLIAWEEALDAQFSRFDLFAMLVKGGVPPAN